MLPEDDDYYTFVPLRLIKDITELQKTFKGLSPDRRVESHADFEAVVRIYDVWKRWYPEDYVRFMKSVAKTREAIVSAGNKGISKEGSAAMQYQLEIPQKLHQCIMILFPNHSYTKEFVKTFVKYLPEFKVTDAKF